MTSNFSRPTTVERAVLKALRQMIATRTLLPGSVVPQDALAAELGVSKVPLREALKLLEGEGLVVYRPHRGYEVAKLNLDDLLEIYRIRELLEAEAVRVAIPKLTPDDIEAMRLAMVEVEDPKSDINQILEANSRFHLALLGASRMPQLLRIIRLLFAASAPYALLYLNNKESLQLVHEEHRKIFSAVKSRDPDAVIEALNAHRSSGRLKAIAAERKNGE